MGKIHTVTLPDIGEGVVEGEVVEWLKEVGDSLEQDEPVVVVMTDKATVELPAPCPGTLAKQHYQPGETAIKDKPLYDIETDAEAVQPKHEEKPKSVTVKLQKKPVPEPQAVPARPPGEKAQAAPPVRKLAKEMGIDINAVAGTGKEGRVTAQDLRKTQQGATAPVTHFPDDEEQPLIGVQGLMAKKMAESKRTIPHFSFHEKVDATRLIKLRESVKQEGIREGLQVTYLPFFIRALSLVITQFPIINSCYDAASNKLVIHKHHNIGIAMATDNGLIVPVLKEVQEMGLPDIVRNFDALKTKALAGKLASSDMKDSTMTISNYGVLGGGGLWATPIINIPEVAILAVNKIHKQPVVKDEQVVVRDILNLSWSFDHRLIDGDLAARVSHAFTALLQNPAQLL